MSHHGAATSHLSPFGQRHEFKRRQHGKDRLVKQMPLHHVVNMRLGMDATASDLTLHHRDEQKRQPHDVVEMRVREEQVQLCRLQPARDAEGTAAGVERQPQLRHQQAGRMPPLVRVIAAGAEQLQSHRVSSSHNRSQ